MYSQNLEELSLTMKKDLQDSTKKLRRLKTKATLKVIVTTLVLIGGITTAVIIPNPISGAIAIGAATVLSGSESIKHTLKRLKHVKSNKKLIKKTDVSTDELVLVSKVKASVNNNPDEPSAPPSLIYPNLRI